MAIRISTGLQAIPLGANGLNTVFDGGAIEWRTGSQPADADDAPSGSLIGTTPLDADSFSAVAAGAIAVNTVPITAASTGTGTIGWGRLLTSGDGGGSSTTDPRLDFSVSLTGAGGDVQGDQVAFTAPEDIILDSLILAWPKS